jgi:hypothetical protein
LPPLGARTLSRGHLREAPRPPPARTTARGQVVQCRVHLTLPALAAARACALSALPRLAPPLHLLPCEQTIRDPPHLLSTTSLAPFPRLDRRRELLYFLRDRLTVAGPHRHLFLLEGRPRSTAHPRSSSLASQPHRPSTRAAARRVASPWFSPLTVSPAPKCI